MRGNSHPQAEGICGIWLGRHHSDTAHQSESLFSAPCLRHWYRPRSNFSRPEKSAARKLVCSALMIWTYLDHGDPWWYRSKIGPPQFDLFIAIATRRTCENVWSDGFGTAELKSKVDSPSRWWVFVTKKTCCSPPERGEMFRSKMWLLIVPADSWYVFGSSYGKPWFFFPFKTWLSCLSCLLWNSHAVLLKSLVVDVFAGPEKNNDLWNRPKILWVNHHFSIFCP